MFPKKEWNFGQTVNLNMTINKINCAKTWTECYNWTSYNLILDSLLKTFQAPQICTLI